MAVGQKARKHCAPSALSSATLACSLLLSGSHARFLCGGQDSDQQGLLPLKWQRKPWKVPEKVQKNIDSIGLELSVGEFPTCSA